MAQKEGIYYVEPLRMAAEIDEMKLAIKRGDKGNQNGLNWLHVTA